MHKKYIVILITVLFSVKNDAETLSCPVLVSPAGFIWGRDEWQLQSSDSAKWELNHDGQSFKTPPDSVFGASIQVTVFLVAHSPASSASHYDLKCRYTFSGKGGFLIVKALTKIEKVPANWSSSMEYINPLYETAVAAGKSEYAKKYQHVYKCETTAANLENCTVEV